MTQPASRRAPTLGWWHGHAVPATNVLGTTASWVGHRFTVDVPGRVFGFMVYADSSLGGNYPIYLQTDNGTQSVLLAATVFGPWPTFPPGGDQWLNARWLHPTIALTPGTNYRFQVQFLAGHWFRTASALSSPVLRNHITYTAGVTSTTFDIIDASGTVTTFAYGVDVLFKPLADFQ